MSVFENREFNGHELVTFGNDGPTALRAIVAVHSTALGPAAGGCRMWPYASTDEAITDALRLSRGMSFKNAMAGLPFGGGKAVIIGDSRRKTPQLFEAFGRFVDTLGGLYITAEDVGTTTADMESVAKQTSFVTGLHRRGGCVRTCRGSDSSMARCALAHRRTGRLAVRNLLDSARRVRGVCRSPALEARAQLGRIIQR